MKRIKRTMNDSEIIIIGSKGQLGTALQEKYPGALAVDSDELDITDPKSIEEFDWDGIKLIINAAAYTNVDGAETPDGKKAAWAVNSDAVKNLCDVAKENDICLVHISTEYVFDGVQGNHTEDETPSPLSEYGASKAAGDEHVKKLPKHYLIRTSWVIGDGKNFVRTMIGLAEKNISPSVVNDQIGRLTFTSELVRAIDHLLRNSCEYGTYNVTNSGDPTSWADITREIFALINRDDLTVTDITTAEYFAGKPEAAKRPLLSTLDLGKIESTGFQARDWRDNLVEYISNQQGKRSSHASAEQGANDK